MFRRGICAVAFAAPLLLFAGSQGCSDEPHIEDLCTWLTSHTNCYARFAEDIFPVGGTPLCGFEFDPASDPVADATGYFMARDALDICIRNGGGQVIFDPPFEVSSLYAPPAFSFTILDARAAVCGAGSYTATQTFSVTINPVDASDAGALSDAGLNDNVVGGTFTSATGEGNGFDVTCPGGEETHHFSSLWTEKCPEHTTHLPVAIFDSSPGIPETDTSAGVAGYVRLRVQFPPADPGDLEAPPRVVQYFDCTIPAPPHHCDDGAQNVGETDVDCGGTCASRRQCGDGQGCLQSGDCQSGVCQTVQGILQCVGP